MNLILVRDLCAADCTMGQLTAGDTTVQVLERPWVPDPEGSAGMAGRSCVPPGTYALELHDTEAHPRTWALVNRALGVIHEPDASMPHARVACLLHPANFVYELRGCVAPGLKRVGHTVQQSRDAFERIRSIVPWMPGHTLTITVRS